MKNPNFALSHIQSMQPYHPPLDGRALFDGILLDFNERTIPVPSHIREALQKWASEAKLQLYPEYFDLPQKIAQFAGVKPEQLMITNGSDQGIDLIFRTFAQIGDKVIIPSPSFPMFAQSAQMTGLKILAPFYQGQNLDFPLEEVLKEIDEKVRIIVICNPNNPTGTLVSPEIIEKIIQKAKQAIVYVDETYVDFSGVAVISLLKKYENLIITRTFSKGFGLASLRIGYLMASPTHINELLKVRGPYDVNMAACWAIEAVLKDPSWAREYATEVMKKSKPMVENFFQKNGIPFAPSGSNFILFKPPEAEKLYKEFLSRGIRLRPQNRVSIEGSLRVTLGTAAQMERFIHVYESILKPPRYAFLDRDGALIHEPTDTYQIDSLEKLKILDGVIEGVKKIQKMGYKLLLVSNQDGLGTASFPLEHFQSPHKKMLEIFAENGIFFEREFICPHFTRENCSCRKPKTGLVDEFLKEYGIDRENSFMCGDRKTDQQFAENLGIRFIPMKTNGSFHDAMKHLTTS